MLFLVFFVQSFSTFSALANLKEDLAKLQQQLKTLNQHLEQFPKPTPTPTPPTPTPTPKTAPISVRDIETSSNENLIQIINGLGVRVFGTTQSYFQEGTQEGELWNSLLKAVDEYFEHPTGLEDTYKKNLSTYQDYLTQLQNIASFLDSIIKNFQDREKLLPQTSENVEKKLIEANTILSSVFNNVIEHKTTEENITTWENKLENKEPTDVFPKIDQFLTDYLANRSMETITKYESGKFAVENILEKLAKVIYLEEQKRWRSKKKNRLTQSKEVFKDINSKYPGKPYGYARAKLYDTKDKPSVIIYSIVVWLYNALTHLKKDIKEISQP